MFRPSENIFDADRKLCRRTLADRSTPAKRILPRNLPIWELSSEAFLVYVAAILLYKPIFTQPLGFILCAAGAVEKSATERAVGVVYLRDSIVLSQKTIVFLTFPNKRFATQNRRLYRQTHCLPVQCVLSVRVQSPLQETASIVVRPVHCFRLVAGVK